MALFFVANSIWIGKVEFVHPEKKYAIARTMFASSKNCTTCLLPANSALWQSSVPRNIGPLYITNVCTKRDDFVKDDVVVVDACDLSKGKNGYFAVSFLHPSWSKSVAKFFEACTKPRWARLKYDNIEHRQEFRKELSVLVDGAPCDVLFNAVACYVVRDFSLLADMFSEEPSETQSISFMSKLMPRLKDETQFICDLAYFVQEPDMILEMKHALLEEQSKRLSKQGQAFVNNADKYHRRLKRLLEQS